MAPRSSMIARAIKNIFSLTGNLFPRSEAAAREKAISVAVGIPHPCEKPVCKLKTINRRAGTIIPPKAAPKGKMAFLNDDSSPATHSRLISVDTSKKKKAIIKLLTQLKMVSGR
jgi:hypothetical protein